jgi:hypothetical protein
MNADVFSEPALGFQQSICVHLRLSADKKILMRLSADKKI